MFDKGKDKGAVIRHQTVLKNEKGEELATLVASRFARGDGGFGGPSEGQPEPHKVPTRAPDRSIDISTRPDQALIYRLCGDRNPLHSDPEFAKRAGFPRPILHGMCTYGITCRGILQTYADYDRERLQAARRAVLLAGLSRRDRDDGSVEGRQRDFIRGQGEGAQRRRHQERQDGAGIERSRHSGTCEAHLAALQTGTCVEDSGSGPSDASRNDGNNREQDTMGLLDGKVALITGAGGGLGEAYAKLFAREGAAVVVNDLGGPRDGTGADVSMAQKVVDAIKAEGGRAVANGADISTMAGGQSVFDDAIKHFGRADILVNNAGILLDQTFAKATEAAWDKV